MGFQREENGLRIESLKRFFSDDRNVIPNSILCSARTLEPSVIAFQPAQGEQDPRSQVGQLIVKLPDLKSQSFVDLLGQVRDYIETRVPELQGRPPTPSLIERLKQQANQDGHINVSAGDDSVQDDSTADTLEESDQSSGGDATGALFEETHIFDFWDEIAARHEVAKLASLPADLESFLGFSREALLAYILPVIVVDGQHRLRGAVEQANKALGQEPWSSRVETAIANGEPAEEVSDRLLREASRYLPVSLLLTENAAEQVFQFVVVNQKATPIGRALLGTIVSTTLSQKELESVAERLRNAGIELEESRAISFLARDATSPFYGKVQRGIDTNAKDLLEWNVLGQLVAIFRNLSGGKLFGETNDYADIWRKRYLDSASIVAEFAEREHPSAFAYWSALDGPWRSVFTQFWSAVRDKLADTSDAEAKNAWGSPRNSNLFNKVTLTILAADFFQYLVETKQAITSADEIPQLVEDWLCDVKPTYFSRDWKLEGVKKDSTGIKRQWAHLWKEYRKDPQRLPQITNFRVARAS